MKTTKQQEVINLLAWYNLGKLSDDENTMVETALKEDPSLKEHLLIEQSMAALVKEDKTLLDGSLFEDSQSRLDGVLAKIDLLEGTQTAAAPQTAEPAKVIAEEKPSLFSQLKAKFDDILTSSSHSFTYAVFAALTVVQLGLLVFFIVPSVNMDSEGGEYYTASAKTQVMNTPMPTQPQKGGTVLIISMEGHIKLEGITSLSSDVKIDLLPSASGYYRVRVNKKLSDIELQELKNELSKKHGAIQFIGEESNF